MYKNRESIDKQKKSAQELKDIKVANKMIKIMQDNDFTHDQMLDCLKLACEQFKKMNRIKKNEEILKKL